MSTQPLPIFTVAQYLAKERVADQRSEYFQGAIYAMGGGSRNHALIAKEAGASLNRQLKGTPCAVAGSDLRVFCNKSHVLTYPDVVVFCESATFLDSERDTLTDATIIVEVLSPSTRNYDRREKFRLY